MGGKWKTRDEFIALYREVHGDKYGYDRVVIDHRNPEIEIFCKVHNEYFKQHYRQHLYGKGCQKCGKIQCHKNKTKTTEWFIAKSKEIHGDVYDYSLTEYTKRRNQVTIICPKHEPFTLTAANHLNGLGCRHCSAEKGIANPIVTQESFIERSKIIHDNKYDYSLVEYVETRKKVWIICPTHGPFPQTPNRHLRGCGCNKCGEVKSGETQKTPKEEFILKAKETHGDKYNYDNIVYNGMKHEVQNIFCNAHRKYFNQNAHNHADGAGCQECSSWGNSFHKSEWIEKAKGKKGTFYILKCWNEEETFYKYGITFNTVKKRYGNGNKIRLPYNYEIIRTIVSPDLSYIWDLEKRFGRFKGNNKYKPKIYFAGSTFECFSHYHHKNTPAGAIVVVDAPKKPIYIQMQLDFAC